MRTKNVLDILQSANLVIKSKIVSGQEITGISDDSRNVLPGNIFVAIKGIKVDGSDHIDEAIARGSKVVVTEKDISGYKDRRISFIQVECSRKALSLLAAGWYKNPAKSLNVIGVTGTKGKTTVVHLLFHILKMAGLKVGMVSTVKAEISEKVYDTGHHVTNPEPLVLQKYLREMVDAGLETAIVEVTSHGLDQERVYGIDFDIGVLTNIVREHLDYHKTFVKYRSSKFKLFENSKCAVINNDDVSSRLIRRKFSKLAITTYSQDGKSDIVGSVVDINSDRMVYNVTDNGLKFRGEISLLGKYNLSNILAACGAAKILGVALENSVKYLSSFSPPEGRLEKVENSRGLHIYIDFAHTPDSLENLLLLLRGNKGSGRLISVFGCAGERDPDKRFKMGKISGNLADISVLTGEDPRSEKVTDIISQIKIGASAAGAKKYAETRNKKQETRNRVSNRSNKREYIEIPDRSEAIYYTINYIAQKGDTVVFCGKGHENSMCYGDIEHPWSDRKEITGSLNIRKGKTAIIMGAGRGKRLNSQLPKVIHTLAGKPMISYTINNLRRAGYSEIIVIVGYRADLVKKELGETVLYAYQKKQLGTGHAAWQGMKSVLGINRPILVVNGDDSAFYNPSTFIEIYQEHVKNRSKLTNSSTILSDPTGIGRLVRDERGKLQRIVEEKAATEEEKKIRESNLNMYVFDRDWFLDNIGKVRKAIVGEYYITDMVEIAISRRVKNNVYILKNPEEWCGVNTPEQLEIADKRMRKRLGDSR